MRARVREKKTITASVREKKKNDHPTRVACLASETDLCCDQASAGAQKNKDTITASEKGKEIVILDAYAERKNGAKRKTPANLNMIQRNPTCLLSNLRLLPVPTSMSYQNSRREIRKPIRNTNHQKMPPKKATTTATKRKPKPVVKHAGKRGSATKKKARVGKMKSDTGFVQAGWELFIPPPHCTKTAQWQAEI